MKTDPTTKYYSNVMNTRCVSKQLSIRLAQTIINDRNEGKKKKRFIKDGLTSRLDKNSLACVVY